MTDQHRYSQIASAMRPLVVDDIEEDVFVENGKLSITTARDHDESQDASCAGSTCTSTRTGGTKKRTRQTHRTHRTSACLTLACLAVAGGAGAVLRSRINSSRAAAAAPAQGSFPVVVRTTFPSASEADSVLQSLNLDVMGRGRRLSTNDGSSSTDGPIERDIMLHSPQDWSALDNAVSSFAIDEDHTAMLFLDESTTYTPPPNRRHLNSDYETMPYRPCYRTVQGTYDTMDDIVATYPSLATVETIGLSYLGEPIRMLKLTGPQSVQSPVADREPLVMTSGLHAREYAPVEIATRLVEHLTSQYRVDADVTAMLDHTVLYVILQSNPDSRKIADNNLAGSQPRKNQNNAAGCSAQSLWGTDLNRNFDFMHGRPGASDSSCHITYHGPTAASEEETKAIQNLSKSVFPAWQRKANPEGDPFGAFSDTSRGLYVDIHAYGNDIIFPYGYEDVTQVGNIDAFKSMSHKICSINQYEPSGSGYNFLGRTSGDTVDYHYGALGVASILYEVGYSWPESCARFEALVYQPNFDALLYTTKLAMTPYRTSLGPDVTGMSVDVSADGSQVTVNAEVSDLSMTQLPDKPSLATAEQTIKSVKAYFDSHPYDASPPQPSMMKPADGSGSFNFHTEAVSLGIDTSSEDGMHMICLQATDSDGYEGTVSCQYVNIPVTTGAAVVEEITSTLNVPSNISAPELSAEPVSSSMICQGFSDEGTCLRLANGDCRWKATKGKCVDVCQGRKSEQKCLKESKCQWNAMPLPLCSRK